MQQHDSMVESTATWQACAVNVYQRTVRMQGAALAALLAAQLGCLTGRHIPPSCIDVHADGQYATARLDTFLFRRYRHGLVLVRPSAGYDAYDAESPVIETQADLGHALAVWYPSLEPATDDPSADVGDW